MGELAVDLILGAGLVGVYALIGYGYLRGKGGPMTQDDATEVHRHSPYKRGEDGIYFCQCGFRYLHGRPVKPVKRPGP